MCNLSIYRTVKGGTPPECTRSLRCVGEAGQNYGEHGSAERKGNPARITPCVGVTRFFALIVFTTPEVFFGGFSTNVVLLDARVEHSPMVRPTAKNSTIKKPAMWRVFF